MSIRFNLTDIESFNVSYIYEINQNIFDFTRTVVTCLYCDSICSYDFVRTSEFAVQLLVIRRTPFNQTARLFSRVQQRNVVFTNDRRYLFKHAW